MPDKGTTQDHIEDLMTELTRTRHVLRTMTDTAHRLHNEAEAHKAEVEELRYQLALAREEANQAYKRADMYRAQHAALGERFSAMCAIQGDLMRKLEEAGLG
jgi:predicted  nucleic acid-binding Zn-ribbon protein